MEFKKKYFRLILLFYFHEDKKAVEAVDFLKERISQNSFKIFHPGVFSLKGDQRSSLPTEVDDEQIKTNKYRHFTKICFQK